jgi:hypothetical protein
LETIVSDYIVTGKKGDGKSLVCVGKIRDALLAGRAVATNLDLNLEKLLPVGTRNVRCYRLPDYPSVDDMLAIGVGSDKLDESTYGLIVLDEMAVWMNAREWGDKRRQALLNWFVHSRKYRWHSMFIAQALDQLDKQFRSALADHQVRCRRLDKLRIPFLGAMCKAAFGFEPRPPKIHTAVVRYGMEHTALVSDRWTYRGHDLYPAYNTEQVFDADYPHGIFSYLSPWHLEGFRHREPFRLSRWLLAVIRDDFPKPKRLIKSKLPLVSLIAALPLDQRMAHYKRFQAAGVL